MSHATLDTLPTPALLLDLPRLRANARAMRQRAARHGVALRPHAKTVKCREAMALALGRTVDGAGPAGAEASDGGGAGPITVSTLAEAAFFGRGGWSDVFWAVSPAWSRIPQAAALRAAGIRLICAADHPETARRLGEVAVQVGVQLPVRIEVDCGYGRAGLAPDDPALVALAEALHSHPGTALDGVFTHAGHSYGCVGADAVRVVAAAERTAVVAAATRLREAGLPCPAVSAGSTPTAVHGEGWRGVTELRPGNYLLFDLTQRAIGSCGTDDIAASVLATVIGRKADHLTIDAGSLALSSDAGAAARDAAVGLGLVCDLDARPLPGVSVGALSQEHGWVRGPGIARLAVGDRVRVLPSHSCTTAAAYGAFDVHEGRALVGRWPRVGGWAPDPI